MEEFTSNRESIVPRTIASTALNPTKKKRTAAADRQMEFMKACTQALSQSTEISEYDAIGINVAAKLKKMENKQRIYADLLINKILSNGLLGTLTSRTDINEPVGTNFRTHYENDVPGTTTFNYGSSSCPNSNSTYDYDKTYDSPLLAYRSDHGDPPVSS